jgi:hypothetical protein
MAVIVKVNEVEWLEGSFPFPARAGKNILLKLKQFYRSIQDKKYVIGVWKL